MTAARPRRILLLGATGTIGRAVVRAGVAAGLDMVCLVRPGADRTALPPEAAIRFGDVTDPDAIARDGIRGERFDAIVSCLASRTGVLADAQAIDFAANRDAIRAAEAATIPRMILLSAICVQRPRLAFQHAKLAAERALMASTLDWTIIRPTAFFKSLSGQVARVARGKPYLVFGDGRLTACKPISDDDLARFIVACLDDPNASRRILPIGGPGPAQTPREQGDMLFALLDREPRFRHVPVAMLDAIVATLSTLGRFIPRLAAKAELARIGRYYATESMLVLDPSTDCYDASLTPEFGTDTLRDHYAALLAGGSQHEHGDHSVFARPARPPTGQRP